MGNACKKSKVKQPTRADPKELEEKARRDAEENARREAEAAAEREVAERARLEAAMEAERLEAEEEAKRLEEEAERTRLEEQRLADEAAAARLAEEERLRQEAEEAQAGETEEPRPVSPGEKYEQVTGLDDVSETTMETPHPAKMASPEKHYGAGIVTPRGRTITPCDMTAVDETSRYVSKRCGCDIGDAHDELNCPICRVIDLSDAPLLN